MMKRLLFTALLFCPFPLGIIVFILVNEFRNGAVNDINSNVIQKTTLADSGILNTQNNDSIRNIGPPFIQSQERALQPTIANTISPPAPSNNRKFLTIRRKIALPTSLKVLEKSNKLGLKNAVKRKANTYINFYSNRVTRWAFKKILFGTNIIDDQTGKIIGIDAKPLSFMLMDIIIDMYAKIHMKKRINSKDFDPRIYEIELLDNIFFDTIGLEFAKWISEQKLSNFVFKKDYNQNLDYNADAKNSTIGTQLVKANIFYELLTYNIEYADDNTLFLIVDNVYNKRADLILQLANILRKDDYYKTVEIANLIKTLPSDSLVVLKKILHDAFGGQQEDIKESQSESCYPFYFDLDRSKFFESAGCKTINSNNRAQSVVANAD